MTLDLNTHILIVGLGLIGGSYAKALKKKGFSVNALDTRQEAITYALEEGIIDKGYTEPSDEAFEDADLLIFALYPRVFVDFVNTHQHKFKKNAILTDVTGVKGCIVYEIQSELREDLEFIAAHPMAGREVYGVENSDDRIFHNANYIVVPTEKNRPETVDLCKLLGAVLGFSRISTLSPEEHDDMIAFVSQLTHVIAISLMTCNDSTHLVDYTGDSFRDLTRIARINDKMWSELFHLNRDALLRQMDIFEEEFHSLRAILESGDTDAMREKMRLSTSRRAMFDIQNKTK
ncbi:MAG: prephenate dehydrogenase [Clostridia bacterium]|nr:prephenate dehydrogenase [Clostridia bacterium]